MEENNKSSIDLSKLSEEELNAVLLQAEALKRREKERRERDEHTLSR